MDWFFRGSANLSQFEHYNLSLPSCWLTACKRYDLESFTYFGHKLFPHLIQSSKAPHRYVVITSRLKNNLITQSF